MLEPAPRDAGSFPTYEHDLTGGERVLPLEELRPWVAYPTNAEEQAPGTVSRRYLAVRDVRIDCPFPHAQVRQPGDRRPARARGVRGAGGPAPRRRPAERGRRRADGEAAGRGHGLLGRRRRARTRPHRLGPRLRGPARLRLPRPEHRRHRGRAGHRHCATTSRPGQQRRRRPVLPGAGVPTPRTPATSSPASCRRCSPTSPRGCPRWTPPPWPAPVPSCTRRPSGSGRSPTTSGGCWRRWRSRRAASPKTSTCARGRLRQDLSAALVGLVGELRAQARAAGEDQAYTDAVEHAYAATRGWITGGLGTGEQAWRDEALRSMTVDRNSSRYAGDELNRVRVEISSSFEEIDVYFAARVRALWERVAQILRDHTGALLGLRRDVGRRRPAPVRRAPRRRLRALPAAAPGRRAAAHRAAGLPLPAAPPGARRSWTDSPCRNATRSPASSATASSSRPRRTAPSSCTRSSCRWPSRPRT